MRDHQALMMLIPEFPGQTHAFFWREIAALEEAGTPVLIASTRRPPPEACPHSFAEVARERSHYLFPPRFGAVLGTVVRHPAGILRAITYVLGLSESSMSERIKLLALIGSAADLVALATRKSIGHVHIHSCANAAHLGALAERISGLPYSMTLHGDLPVYGTDHTSKMARARFVAAVTRPLAEQVAEVAPDKPAPVIWMGVDTDRFAPSDVARAPGPFRLVTVARLNRTKGHRFALHALAKLRDAGVLVHYTIIGDGPERSALETEIAELALADQVTLAGSLGEDEVRAALHNADALALTSIGQGEAAPVTVMEAMACGLPVVCSIIGGTPDMITDGKDGFLVAQEDVSAIAQRLSQLVEDEDLRKRIGAAARQTALVQFDYRSNAGKLLAEIRNEARK